MSSVTREFTKEQLIARAETVLSNARTAADFHDSEPYHLMDVHLAEIALASLEAEPVAWRHFQKTPTYVGYWILNDYKPNCSGVEPLYTAPPAPESVPDGVLKSLLPDAEKSEFWFEHDGKILFEGVKFNNAVFDACRAAMLQGAEPVTTANKLPANTPCKDAPENIWLQTAGVWPENGEFSELTWCSDNQHPDDTLYVRADVVTGNSPVIPDGWVLVPVEPTHEMLEAGDEQFGTYDVYRRMIAAAPQQEAK